MEITFVTSESGKTKYWGVLDGITFLQTGTQKAAKKLLAYLQEKNGLQTNLSDKLSGEQVDSTPTSDTSVSSDGIRVNDFDGSNTSQEESDDPGLRSWLEAREKAEKARASAERAREEDRKRAERTRVSARERAEEASRRLDETRERNANLVFGIVSDYSRLVDATVKASLLSSSTEAKSLEPQTIDVLAT
jgi:hypothetical protein